jgi:hypothetical protein
MPKSWKLPLASAILLAASANLYAQAPSAEAMALASAMQVAEQAREGVLAGVQAAIQQGRATQKEFDCIKAANLGGLESAYATAFDGALTPAEMKEAAAALKFVGGSAGKKLLERRSFETAELRSALVKGISEAASKCKP